MLPNVGFAIRKWERPTKIKTITQLTDDFVPADTIVVREQLCVVHAADKTKLNPDLINWSKAYVLILTRGGIDVDEVLEFAEIDYKIIDKSPLDEHGFNGALGEATNKALLVASE